jgi:DNA repair photolyase
LVAPVLPGLSDSEAQLTEVVEACAAAGAVSVSGVPLHLRGTVRGHYFDWLSSARPDLVRLHRGRFRRGAYQEDDERERVAGIVRAAARRCGMTGRDRHRGRVGDSDGEAGATATKAVEDRPLPAGRGGQQLRLL